MNSNYGREDKFSFRVGSGAAATLRCAEQAKPGREIAPMRFNYLMRFALRSKVSKSIAHRSTVSKAEDYELNPFSRRGGGNCGGYWGFKNVLTFRL